MSTYTDRLAGLEDDPYEEIPDNIPLILQSRVYLTANMRKHFIQVFDEDDKEIGIIEKFDFPAMFEMVLLSSTKEQLKRYLKTLVAKMNEG